MLSTYEADLPARFLEAVEVFGLTLDDFDVVKVDLGPKNDTKAQKILWISPLRTKKMITPKQVIEEIGHFDINLDDFDGCVDQVLKYMVPSIVSFFWWVEFDALGTGTRIIPVFTDELNEWRPYVEKATDHSNWPSWGVICAFGVAAIAIAITHAVGKGYLGLF